MGAALELMAIENRTNPKLEAEYMKQDVRVRSMVDERQAQDAPMVRDVGWGGSNRRGQRRWGSEP
jgi:hypothetical protein